MEGSLILITPFLLASFISGIESASLIITNDCPYTIWPAAQSDSYRPLIGNISFSLDVGESNTINPPSGWRGRIWARTFCSGGSGQFRCPIGDCGTGEIACNEQGGATPISLAEIQLNAFSNNDYYDVSLVDGFNLPMTIEPQNGSCPAPSCPVDINSICPANLAVRLANGAVAGCRRTDPGLFKAHCPDAYANPSDPDTKSCPSAGNYVITFCPEVVTTVLGVLCQV